MSCTLLPNVQGATGSGKTYTMVGGPGDPGLMILSLERIFAERQRLFGDEDFEVQCSYLEVYNEVRRGGGRRGNGCLVTRTLK